MINLTINGKSHSVDVEPDTPLLWVIRDSIGMTGTKYGCGIAQCGSCSVHVNGEVQRSCQIRLGDVGDAKIVTIEGLPADGSHPVQRAWAEHDVPQCGYCQSGQIMSACALLAQNRKPSDADIDAAMSGNICRCGTYNHVRAAIHDAAVKLQKAT